MFFFDKDKKKLPPVPKELAKHVETLEEKIRELSSELKEFKQHMRKAITKAGVVRFNPFKGTGSDQSFVIALLNEDNNGTVVSSHYLKEYNRVYAKPIINGQSEYSLSEEEKEAIAKAMNTSI